MSLEFRNKAIALFNQGIQPLNALQQAGQECSIHLTKSMYQFPSTYIYNFIKDSDNEKMFKF